MPELFLIFLGGGLGSLSRYWLNYQITENLITDFPLSTFVVNISGSFLIGIFWGLIERAQLETNWRSLLVTGFCGGFTTFSTFSFDNYQLLQRQDYLGAIAYSGLSLFWGFSAVSIGLWLVKLIDI